MTAIKRGYENEMHLIVAKTMNCEWERYWAMDKQYENELQSSNESNETGSVIWARRVVPGHDPLINHSRSALSFSPAALSLSYPT